MSTQRYTAIAREAWNEVAPIHWQKTAALISAFEDPATSFITPIHAAELARIGIAGMEVAQLNCNNGRELISMVRLGASRGVGFDIASEFVAQARQLAEAADASCTFEAVDVYEIASEFDGRFDLVVVTSGALCFMPDLARYMQTAKRLLRPQGRLNIYDCHPIMDMFDLDRDRKTEKLEFVRSYFDQNPLRHVSGLDYIGNTTYEAKEIFYFHHTLEDIVTAIIDSGFSIEKFKETDEDPSNAYSSVAARAIKPPLSFMLTARSAG